MTTTTLQNEKTLRFWDEYHDHDPGSASLTTEDGDDDTATDTEWIVRPSRSVLERLYDRLPRNDDDDDDDHHGVRVLEIGCGTSTLSRDFGSYCRDRGRDVYVRATDASPVCLRRNRERDRAWLGDGRLEYRVCNVAEEDAGDNHHENNHHDDFDLILDKGCLDTFLFRSRRRGEHKDALVRTVLHNVHALLRVHTGVYCVVTPRVRFRPLREYPGFVTVERTTLDDAQGKLEGAASTQQERLYLYTCRKGDAVPQHSGTFAVAPTISPPPEDHTACPRCGVTFVDFRRGEAVAGRGAVYWTRRFRGHRLHCNGDTDHN